jgi:hypothetical protein
VFTPRNEIANEECENAKKNEAQDVFGEEDAQRKDRRQQKVSTAKGTQQRGQESWPQSAVERTYDNRNQEDSQRVALLWEEQHGQ